MTTQHKTRQDKIGLDVEGKTGQYRTVQYSTVQHSTVQKSFAATQLTQYSDIDAHSIRLTGESEFSISIRCKGLNSDNRGGEMKNKKKRKRKEEREERRKEGVAEER